MADTRCSSRDSLADPLQGSAPDATRRLKGCLFQTGVCVAASGLQDRQTSRAVIPRVSIAVRVEEVIAPKIAAIAATIAGLSEG